MILINIEFNLFLLMKVKTSDKKTKSSYIRKNPESATINPYIRIFLYITFFLAVFSFTSHKIEDDDFFWHLSTGKYITETGSLPSSDVFGYAKPDEKWIPFEWGADIIMYKLYQSGGYTLIFIFRSLIFCIIFYLILRIMEKFRVNAFICFFISFLLLTGLFNRYSPRPHLFSYLFITILLFLFLNIRGENRTKYFRFLYLLPLLFLIWGNIHPGVITGLIIFAAFTAAETVLYLYPAKFRNTGIVPFTKEQYKKIMIVFGISVIMLVINPNGINTYLYIYSHTKMKMLENIAEWLSPFSSKIESNFVIKSYIIFLILSAVSLFYSYRKKDLFFALLIIIFGIYSFTAIRFSVDFILITAPLSAISAGYFLNRLKNKTALKITSLTGSYPVLIILILFFGYTAYAAQNDNFYISLKYNREAGMGISGRYFPLGLYNFIKENNIQGIPFNNFDTGGYLKWIMPEQKIFIDSRNLSDELFNEYSSIIKMQPGFEKKLEKYGINQVIFFDPFLIRFPNLFKQNITEYLFNNSGWVLVYWDDLSVMFLKRTPENTELISKFGYTVFSPYTALFNKPLFDSNVKAAPISAQNEAKRKQAAEPEGYFFKGVYAMMNEALKNKGTP